MRAARAGESDAWNSFAAGALSGALISRAARECSSSSGRHGSLSRTIVCLLDSVSVVPLLLRTDKVAHARMLHCSSPLLRCHDCDADGRGFHLLGMVAWAPLCGAVHWAYNELRLEAVLQHWLARQGLLDLPPHLQQQELAQQQADADAAAAAAAAQQAQQGGPRRVEDLTYREKKAAVEAIKQRELEQLHAALRQQEAQQELAAAQPAPSGKRGWFG